MFREVGYQYEAELRILRFLFIGLKLDHKFNQFIVGGDIIGSFDKKMLFRLPFFVAKLLEEVLSKNFDQLVSHPVKSVSFVDKKLLHLFKFESVSKKQACDIAIDRIIIVHPNNVRVCKCLTTEEITHNFEIQPVKDKRGNWTEKNRKICWHVRPEDGNN